MLPVHSGNPYQYFHYTAWGESFAQAEATQGSFSSSFRFNAKELDAETGNYYYYYGARYYHPKWSVWLSVDRLASKGPSFTPYSFSHNNPVMLVDPDGNWPFWLGVTTTYSEARISLGAGVLGAHAVVQSGVARDEVGKTHFTNSTNVVFNTLNDKTETLALGGMISVMGGVSQDFDTETYLGQSFESSASVTAGAAYGWSVSVSAGERGVGVSAGAGLGAEVTKFPTETLESISLSWDEADQVDTKATRGNTKWHVGEKRKLDVGTGTYVGKVSIGAGKDRVNTDILIYSRDGKTWMSKQYENLAREEEGL